ncbi:MAG: DUF192 domain-containing protein [Nanobdellota archaeon]
MEHSIINTLENIVYLKSIFSKARGLMFRKPIKNEAYIFDFGYERKIPIHMLFVFFSIDVIWVDLNGIVVDIKKNVKPFTPAIYHRGKASTLIELPKGFVDNTGIKLMDKIKFQ